jgi:hypothetical protein
MADYRITGTSRVGCTGSQSHISRVVLDRGGEFDVTDIYDFMEHGGHRFFTSDSGADEQREVSKLRCRHCGRPTLRLAPVHALDTSSTK